MCTLLVTPIWTFELQKASLNIDLYKKFNINALASNLMQGIFGIVLVHNI